MARTLLEPRKYVRDRGSSSYIILNLQLWDFSKGLNNEFETAMVNEPSVFEPLKFYCMTDYLEISDSEDESTRRRRATTTGMDNTILRMGDHLIFLITQNGKIPVK